MYVDVCVCTYRCIRVHIDVHVCAYINIYIYTMHRAFSERTLCLITGWRLQLHACTNVDSFICYVIEYTSLLCDRYSWFFWSEYEYVY